MIYKCSCEKYNLFPDTPNECNRLHTVRSLNILERPALATNIQIAIIWQHILMICSWILVKIENRIEKEYSHMIEWLYLFRMVVIVKYTYHCPLILSLSSSQLTQTTKQSNKNFRIWRKSWTKLLELSIFSINSIRKKQAFNSSS